MADESWRWDGLAKVRFAKHAFPELLVAVLGVVMSACTDGKIGTPA